MDNRGEECYNAKLAIANRERSMNCHGADYGDPAICHCRRNTCDHYSADNNEQDQGTKTWRLQLRLSGMYRQLSALFCCRYRT